VEYLSAGDVWKYGETTRIRYSDKYLTAAGLIQRDEYYGTQRQIKIMEKYRIYSYFLIWGKLPPGNKIFR
jgi:hypothetical protein